jgi:hypothetical protein
MKEAMGGGGVTGRGRRVRYGLLRCSGRAVIETGAPAAFGSIVLNFAIAYAT